MSQPDWKGLFEWSIKQQGDGTNQDPSSVRPVSEEERKWFMEAMESQQEDLVKRMKNIKVALDEKDDADEQVAEKLQLLEDLTEIVENIDYARDLTHIGGLGTLLGLLGSGHPELRAAAAEVAATCVQNNPPVQQMFLDGGALPRLLALFADPDPTCRRKALLALSCLARNHGPALDAFRAEGGLRSLIASARDGADPRQQRKALQLAAEVLRERPGDIREAFRAGLNQALPAALRSGDPGVRQAALALLAGLVQHPGVVAVLQKDNELLRELQATQARLNGLDVEDLDAEHESLALAEHALQKLRGSGPAGGEEPPLPAAEEAGGPAKQQQQGRGQGQAQPNGEGATGTGTQPPEEAQKPLALLGPP